MKKQPKYKLVEDDEGNTIDAFNVRYVPNPGGKFIIDIDGPIISSQQMDYAVQVLELADEQKSVQINLQTGGGSLNATDRLLHAMRNCDGDIHIVATGGVHSCGTLILLEADSFELSDGFNACIHNGSLGNGGNFNEYASKAGFDIKYMEKFIRSSYERFLSQVEIESLILGKDIWVDAQEWVDRIKARQIHFMAKIEAMQEAQETPKPKTKRNKPVAIEE